MPLGPRIEVVFTDETPAAADPRLADTVEAAPHQQPGPPVTESPTGPRKRWKGEPRDERPAAGDAGKAADMVAKALGLGVLSTTASRLADAYGQLWKAVKDSTEAHKANATTVERAIDAELIPTGTAVPGPPGVGAFERQIAKGEVPAPPQTRAVGGQVPTIGWWERMAARGTPQAPPVAAGPGAAAGAAGAAGAAAGPAAAGGAGAAGQAAGGLAAVSAVAGPLAIAFAAMTAAVVAGGAAVKKLVDVMAAEADRLSGLSADVAGATARSGLRAELADIRRAGRIGPDLAKFEDLRGRGMEKLADIQTELLKIVLQFVTAAEPAINVGIQQLSVIAAGMAVLSDAMLSQLEAAQGNLAALTLNADELKNIRRLQKELVKFARMDHEDELADGRDPFMEAFRAQFGKAAPGFPPFPAPAPAGGPP